MPVPLNSEALAASRYETVDPATIGEVERNAAIADLQRLVADRAAVLRGTGKVLPMRVGGRR
jgi:hypothetical protein